MMFPVSEPTGKWYSYGPGGPGEDIPEHIRQELLRQKAEREERRGRLLAVVQVHVWENGESNPQVSFPEGCALSPLDSGERIAEVVRIARDALGDWR
jgi:hypothetical protein